MNWMRSIVAVSAVSLGNYISSFGWRLSQFCGDEFDILCEFLDIPIMVMSPEELYEFLNDIRDEEEDDDD